VSRLFSYLRSIHQEGTPDSWARWAGTFFLFIVAGVVVAALFGHAINETVRGLLADTGYAVLGGSALRKGMEVAGQVSAKWAPPATTTLPVTDDTRAP
jgi:hypothetical protein